MLTPTDYELDLPITSEEIKKELYKQANKGWVTASLSPKSAWVKDATKIWFRSRFIYLIPLENDKPAYATTLITGEEERQDTQKVLSAFLASLSWAENISLSVEHWGGGGMPNPMGYKSCSISLLFSSIDRDYIQDPQDEKARLALAFYREGSSIGHVFYSFLSFYKIINMLNPTGKDQIDWINKQLSKLSYESQERLEELKKTETDIGKYLYGSGRCAIAHAGGNPTADPDNPDDQKRLRNDTILIKDLSAVAIEETFGIKSRSSIYMNGEQRITKLLDIFDKQLLKEGILKTDIPFISLVIRGKEPNPLTEKLYFSEKVNIANKIITMDMFTHNNRAIVRFFIDNNKNDLFIDYRCAVYKLTADDDIINAEIDLNALILWNDYLGNGQIRIYSPEGTLLASSTPYMPNLALGRSKEQLLKNIELAKLKLATF